MTFLVAWGSVVAGALVFAVGVAYVVAHRAPDAPCCRCGYVFGDAGRREERDDQGNVYCSRCWP
jgi:hypothetical protein